MGVNCIKLVQAPPCAEVKLRALIAHAGVLGREQLRRLGVVVQVAFIETRTLKPVSHLIGSRVDTKVAFKLWANWIQLVQPPPRWGTGCASRGSP
jgi:hypothetical protein